MQLQSQKTCDQSKQSSSQGIQQLKKKISYTNIQLHEIISNPQKFNQRIKQLNRKASKQNNQQTYEEAIIYLAQAQKNLEYAANCGLAIDRLLITTTLKNQACIYQRLWQLSTCYDYMQALIFNISIYNQDSKDIFTNPAIKQSQSEEYKTATKILNQKLNLALCYLQFSALSSQLGKHQQAQKAVQKSIQQFKILCDYCEAFQKIKKNKTTLLLDQIRLNIQYKQPKIRIQNELKQIKQVLHKIKNHSYFFTFDQSIIEKLSMGDIMQIQFLTIEQANKLMDVDWFVSQLGLTYISIYVACCYFALATQIRLNSQQTKFLEQSKRSQMNLAKIYHLHSIKMASELVFIESNFLTHIIKSFKNNFNIDIQNQNFQNLQHFQQSDNVQVEETNLNRHRAEPKVEQLKKNHNHHNQFENNIKVNNSSGSHQNNNIDHFNNPTQTQKNSYIEQRLTKKSEGQKIKKEVSNKKLTTLLKSNSPRFSKKSITQKRASTQKQVRQKIREKSIQQKKQTNKIVHIVTQLQKNKNQFNQYFSNVVSKYQKQDKSKNMQKLPKTKTSRNSKSRSKPKLKVKQFKLPMKH